MKLSEITGEAALDLLADIIEPAAEIMSDPKVKELFEKNKAAGETPKARKAADSIYNQ